MNAFSHHVVLVNETSNLLSAIKEEFPAIEVDLKLLDNLLNQISQENSRSLLAGTAAKIGAASVITAAATVANPILATLIAYGSVTTFLFSPLMKTELSKYDLFAFTHQKQVHIMLLHKEQFNRKSDKIAEYLEYKVPYRRFGHSICPNCKCKIDKSIEYAEKNVVNPFFCPNCNQKLITNISFGRFIKQFTEKELSERDIKVKKALHDRELKKRGLQPDKKSNLQESQICGVPFLLRYNQDVAMQQPNHEEVLGYRQRLKKNEFTAEPFFTETDGDIYRLTSKFYTASFGTADADKAILDLVRYYNILGRQIAGTPMDLKERSGMTLLQESYHNNKPAQHKTGKYQNVLKEAAWGAVHCYLYGIPADVKTYLRLSPTDLDRVAIWNQWNEYVNAMIDVPDSVKELFTGSSKENLEITQIIKRTLEAS